MTSFLDLAKARFSSRQFTLKPVEREKLEKILEAGKVAPTAKNQQPQRIYVVQSEEGLKKLNRLTRCIYGATTILMIAYDETRAWQNPLEEGVHSGEVDVSIVATHMMMEAADLGLGSCWVGWFPPRETAREFNLPDTVHPVLLLPIGYTSEEFRPSPTHTQYREDKDMVEFI